MSESLLKAVSVEPIFITQEYEEYGRVAVPIGLRLYLEDGRFFEMYHVPFEVIEALLMIRKGEPPPRRQSLFSFLAFHENFRDMIGEVLDRVVIDEYDESTGLYTATVHFEADGIRLAVKMIPSHAIYLATISDKPVYVSEELVALMEEMEEEFDEYGDEEEGYGEDIY